MSQYEPIYRGQWHGQKCFFGFHHDLHVMESDRDIGARCTARELVPLLRLTGADFVQTDAKGHTGYTSWCSRNPFMPWRPAKMRALPSCLLFCLLGGILGCMSTPGGSLRTIDVAGAPKALGPYAQGVVANGFVYTAGQIPVDPVSGKLVEGDISAQVNRVFDNLEAVLNGAGCTLQDVVKVTVFMTDLAEFGKMNEVFTLRFGTHRPARTTVQVSRLPGNARLEIDLVARLPQ